MFEPEINTETEISRSNKSVLKEPEVNLGPSDVSKAALKEIGYVECAKVLAHHGKTFDLMAKLLGKEKGKAIAAVYGFARTSDDIVDRADPQSKADISLIQEQLSQLIGEVKLALKNQSSDPRALALAETIEKYKIDFYPFEDLIAGVSMDLSKSRYETYEELELYCYRVAGTIGLMITPVAGYQINSPALQSAKILGTAFQLTNILRDIGEDFRLGRVYLPKTELNKFQISEEDLSIANSGGKYPAMFRSFMIFQIERAFSLYRTGEKLIPLIYDWKGRLAFQFAIDAYSGILKKIKKNNYNVFTKRAHLTLLDKILLVPKSFFKSQFYFLKLKKRRS